MITSGPAPIDGRLAVATAEFLEAAQDAAQASVPPPPGEWDAGQILAHVSILTANTLRVTAAVAAGEHAGYDNRIAHDDRMLAQLLEAAGGPTGLQDRIRTQIDALGRVAGTLHPAELDTTIPTLLVSRGAVLLDGPLRLGDLLDGFADQEIRGHTVQIAALGVQGDQQASVPDSRS